MKLRDLYENYQLKVNDIKGRDRDYVIYDIGNIKL